MNHECRKLIFEYNDSIIKNGDFSTSLFSIIEKLVASFQRANPAELAIFFHIIDYESNGTAFYNKSWAQHVYTEIGDEKLEDFMAYAQKQADTIVNFKKNNIGEYNNFNIKQGNINGIIPYMITFIIYDKALKSKLDTDNTFWAFTAACEKYGILPVFLMRNSVYSEMAPDAKLKIQVGKNSFKASNLMKNYK